MSAKGFSIQVGRRYQSRTNSGYSCLPSHVGTDRVTFDKFDANGKKWGQDDMLHQSFRSCYAPIAPDLLKESVEHVRNLLSAYRCTLLHDGENCIKCVCDIAAADAFLASVEVK